MVIQPLSKYQNGETLDEYRHRRRTSRQTTEKVAKGQAKAMDQGRCRWPRCECNRRGYRTFTEPLESAHRAAKGMGGNPDGSRNDPRNLITLCRPRHQGPTSLHSGDLKVITLTADGTRGPCEFWSTDEQGRPFLVAREREPFIYERD